MSKKCVLSLVAVIGLAWSGMASAATTANFEVSATVLANCSIFATAIPFGSYDPYSASDVTQTGTVTVSCTKSTNADIALSHGANANGSTRRMTDGANFLTYELYTTAAHDSVWGDNVGTDTVSYSSSGIGDTTLTVYGLLPAGQDVVPGSYSDTVTATIIF